MTRSPNNAPAPTARHAAWWTLRVSVVALTVTLLLVASPGSVTAHASIDRAEPAPDSTLAVAPSTVRIWFTEPVSANASGIEVLDTTGRRVDRHDSRVDLNDPKLVTVGLLSLPDGTYTVAWRNTSTVDGHPLRGTYAFAVGRGAIGGGSATTEAVSDLSPFDPIARWLVLAGLLVALGVEVFARVVLAPVRALREAREADLALDPRITQGAMLLALAASLLHVALEALHGTNLVTGTRWGQLWGLRVALIVVSTLLVLRRREARWTRSALIALLTLSACTLPFASHAAALTGLELTAVANDLVHTLAAAVWTGGLVALLVTVLAVVRGPRALPEARRRVVLAELTRRFSPIAMIATAALLITGLYSTWLQVVTWSALATPYGWALIAKVAAYAALIVVAAVNLLWVTRRLRGSDRAARTLIATVGVEVVLVLAALLAAGFLTGLEPAREAAGRGAKQAETTSGTVRVRVAVSPGSVGVNRVEVRVDDRGRPLADNGSGVTLAIAFIGADLGVREVSSERDASGAYVASNVVLSLEGPWQFHVGVTNSGSFDTQAAVLLPIGAAGTVGIALPKQRDALLAAGWQVVILAVVVLVVSEAWWKRMRSAHVANWAGTGLVIAGIMMVYGVGHAESGVTPIGGRANPIVRSDASIELGRALYVTHCAACHGPRGLGDGPSASALNPPPASLPLHVPLHSDGDVFAFIENGFPGSAMPAFRGALTEEQMWHLVNYLRTLKPPTPAASSTP